MAAPAAVAAAAKAAKTKKILDLVIKKVIPGLLVLFLGAGMFVFTLLIQDAEQAAGASCGLPGNVIGGTYAPQAKRGINYSVVAIVYNVGKQKNADARMMLAAFETALVEAGFANPASEAVPSSKNFPHDWVAAGDHDSVGVFQQRVGGNGRDGKPWGTIQQIMDPSWSASRFFDSAFVMSPRTQGSAGKLAQEVQISARPEKYDQREKEAQKLLLWAEANAGNSVRVTTGGGGTSVGAAGWVMPLAGNPRVTSQYGVWRGTYRHAGVDLAAPSGTEVLSANAGTISRRFVDTNSGNVIEVDHGTNPAGQRVTTKYHHNTSFVAELGSTVKAGQVIALSGNTGKNTTGPHLHFEVRLNGEHTDPLAFLKSNGAETVVTPTACSSVDGSLQDPGTGAPGANGLTPRAANLQAEIEKRFGCAANPQRDPCISVIYGYRPGTSGEHPLGRAIDVMVDLKGQCATGSWAKLGQEVSDFTTTNANNLGVQYVIWQQRYWAVTDPKWDPMSNRGDCNQNHYNHVHITVKQ